MFRIGVRKQSAAETVKISSSLEAQVWLVLGHKFVKNFPESDDGSFIQMSFISTDS